MIIINQSTYQERAVAPLVSSPNIPHRTVSSNVVGFSYCCATIKCGKSFDAKKLTYYYINFYSIFWNGFYLRGIMPSS